METQLSTLQNFSEKGNEFEPMAKLLAADAVAQSLTFSTERKYLSGINKNSSPFCLSLAPRSYTPSAPSWIRISQVGKSISNNAEQCFSAIQKILTSCFIPNKSQLIFVIHSKDGNFEMYLGLRHSNTDIEESFVDSLNDFIQGIWPGMRCQRVKTKEGLSHLRDIRNKMHSDNKNSYMNDTYECIAALTGIPSMESQYKSLYPSSIDALLTGMRKNNFTYMVVADPIPEPEIDGVLYQLREFNGQAESLKTFNFSENTSDSYSKAFQESKNWSKTDNSKSTLEMIGAGLSLASTLFPPAGAVTAALSVASSGLKQLTQNELIASLSPKNEQTIGGGSSVTDTTSVTYGKAVSHNVVSKQVEAVACHLESQSKRFETGKAIGCWSVGVYLMTENEQDMQGASMQLKSIVSGQESIYEPIRIHQIDDVFVGSETFGNTLGSWDAPRIIIQSTVGTQSGDDRMFYHPLGSRFNDLRTVLTTKELSYYINFPLHSVPGINVVEATAGFSLSEQKMKENVKAIDIGKLLWSGSSSEISVKLPLDTLSRHALVCGVNGSGKTNTVLSILDGFMKADRPFFVIEPAKTEYVDWAIEYNKTIHDPKKKIKIFIPGCDNYAKSEFRPEKLRLNPFEVIELPGSEMRVLSHIDRLKASFAAAFPMQDILPVIMEHLLYDLYTCAHPMLDKEDSDYMKKGFPTLGTVDRRFIEDLMTNVGYAQENTQNISAALRTRFKSLKFGWKGELLNNERLSCLVWDDSSKCYNPKKLTWDEIFGTPVVVNLSYAGDDQDRAFIMSLLLQFLYEYRIAESETGRLSFNSNVCRHLVVVEEAHRVMAYCDNQEAPQYKSGLMFSNFLSEVRAYGQGMMVVDQVPTRLIEDAIKNTNVKIIHKLVASDDCQRIAECIGLTEDQQRVIAKLSIGQAVLAGFNSANVMSENSSDIYLAQINKMK